MTRSRRPFPDLPLALPPNLQFVLALSPSVMTLGLDHMRALMARLGHPERRFRSVLIAGTNGKGSTTTMLAAILAGHGVRTGRYTSPHVFNVAERIVVDGAPASIDELEAAAARLVPLRDQIPYSYFEALTAIAFLVFAARKLGPLPDPSFARTRTAFRASAARRTPADDPDASPRWRPRRRTAPADWGSSRKPSIPWPPDP